MKQQKVKSYMQKRTESLTSELFHNLSCWSRNKDTVVEGGIKIM